MYNSKTIKNYILKSPVQAVEYINKLIEKHNGTSWSSNEEGFAYSSAAPILREMGFKCSKGYGNKPTKWCTVEEYSQREKEKRAYHQPSTPRQSRPTLTIEELELVKSLLSNAQEINNKEEKDVFYGVDYKNLKMRSYQIDESIQERIDELTKELPTIRKYVIFNKLLEIGLDNIKK